MGMWSHRVKGVLCLLLSAVMAALVPTSMTDAQPEAQTVSVELVSAGIEGGITGRLMLTVPGGYDLVGINEEEHTWSDHPVIWVEREYRSLQLHDTMTSPDGEHYTSVGEQYDGFGLAGGVIYLRGPADIRDEVEQHLRPRVDGEIYEEGPITVTAGDARFYGYVYLSTLVKENETISGPEGEEVTYHWTSVHHGFDLRLALSQTEPLYTLALWGWTWGLPDRTDEHGWTHVYTIDGVPLLDQHRRYLSDVLSSLNLHGWSAPLPAEAPALPEVTPVVPTRAPSPPPVPATPIAPQVQVVTGSSWLDTIRLPTEISTAPSVMGTNLGLALFFALAFALTSTLFNQTLEANEEWFRAKLSPVLRLLRRHEPTTPPSPEAGAGRILKPIVLLLGAALLYAFLDSGFGLHRSGAVLVLSLFVALAVTLYSYEGLQAWLAYRRYGVRSRLRLFPFALAFGVGCVLLTRWLDFHPGYLYGFVAGFAFLESSSERKPPWALLILCGSAALLVASLAAWTLAVPARSLAVRGFPGASLVYGMLVGIFVAGLEGVLLSLVPITFLDGATLLAWNRGVWLASFLAAAWLFFHVLINPGSAYLAALSEKKVLWLLATLGGYGALTLGTWWFFRGRVSILESAIGRESNHV